MKTCGDKSSIWLKNKRFTTFTKLYLKNLLKKINNIYIIISHNHDDHSNLLNDLIKFLNKNKTKYVIINDRKDNDFDKNIKNLKNFFPGFETTLYVSKYFSKNENRNSLVIKIKGIFENGESYSFLLTGDADSGTLNNIIKLDSNKEKEETIKNVFEDVIFFCIPHHGSLSEGSYKWSEKILKYSRFPTIFLISSEPQGKDKIPKIDMIKKLIYDMANKLNKIKNENYKHYYCIPHEIKCYLGPYKESIDVKAIYSNFHFLSFKEYMIPLFITTNTVSYGYNITTNSNSLVLKDNVINPYNKEILIPLYEYNIYKDFTSFQQKIEAYTYYLANDTLQYYESLKSEVNDSTFLDKDKYDYDDDVEIIDKLNIYNKIIKINKDICDETKDKFNNYKQDKDSIRFFILMTLCLLKSIENVKQFIFVNYENDIANEESIEEIINDLKHEDYEEIFNIYKNDYNNENSMEIDNTYMEIDD